MVTLPEIQQIQVEALIMQEEAICEHECHCPHIWARVHLKWTEAKWKTVQWSN